MKKYLLTALLCTLCISFSFAQDVITKKTGDELKVKILEITPTEVKFKKEENLDGPVYSLPKTDILLVQYANKTTEVFSSPETEANALTVSRTSGAITTTTPAPAVSKSAQELFIQGQTDAHHYYTGYTGAGTGTLVASLLSPLVGLVPAVICSTTKPKEQNLSYPSQELMNNADYNRGYTSDAKRIKSRKVWKNWGIGLGVNIVAAILLANQ
ncbi:hypothetical protein [Pontibacter sp. SGAir0037]|uniref:hypothetical protein n=1 Tax=Pontibacter sp. SGAir0037 TaxID=2571030 RepID=UPI0010CCD477|nr:hypothetical protein [Pontibacter sp. SGAir0037]QCR21367.1 hypothetical protein C1N53_02725 [Pontibacter sp. SGAir0037]